MTSWPSVCCWVAKRIPRLKPKRAQLNHALCTLQVCPKVNVRPLNPLPDCLLLHYNHTPLSSKPGPNDSNPLERDRDNTHTHTLVRAACASVWLISEFDMLSLYCLCGAVISFWSGVPWHTVTGAGGCLEVLLQHQTGRYEFICWWQEGTRAWLQNSHAFLMQTWLVEFHSAVWSKSRSHTHSERIDLLRTVL